jgi:radical SAM superfamily enzyme YgiQ (UPF0313 family)
MNAARAASSSCRVLLVYPRFVAPSFWDFRETCGIFGARYPTPPLALITVAAMLPPSWTVRLVDRNTGTLEPHDLDWADLVLTTGMFPQQIDTLEVIRLAHAHGKPVGIGGPDVTSSPHIYVEADFRVLGEAELVIDDFIAAWERGERKGVFEAEKFKADITRTPLPRFDLLRFNNYLYVGVQYSRGCPFTCEFCDIIELYGRVPRTKTNEQMLAEIQALYDLGYRGHVDFVDDNFIGNKKAIKQFLPHLSEWQRAHNWPFEFTTEASINLADDAELLQLMRDANFIGIFVGIESPDPVTLNSMKKKQNTRRSLVESVEKIYAAGIFVNAGFILGFDSEQGSIAQPMVEAIEAMSIPVCMVGLLYALPNTQLTRRLMREGRLHSKHDQFRVVDNIGDQCTLGLNFETVRERSDILADFAQVLERLYAPDAYFTRVRDVGLKLRLPPPGDAPGFFSARTVFGLFRLLGHVLWHDRKLVPRFWRTARDCHRQNPNALPSVIVLMALYLHLGPFAMSVVKSTRKQIAAISSGKWEAPPLVPAGAPLPQTPPLQPMQAAE